MELYEVIDSQFSAEDNALVARILPLPKGILPSTRFMKQTREMLLALNTRAAYKAA